MFPATDPPLLGLLGRLRKAAALSVLVIGGLLFTASEPSLANGWEHTAVPYETLVKALETGQAETRARAAQSLGIRGQGEAVTPLLALLARPEEDPRVRQAIYGALGRLGEAAAQAALFGCLEDATEAAAHAVCAEALGQVGDAAALPYLLAAAADRDAPLVRAKALTALGRLKHPTAEGALIAVFSGAGDAGSRLRALRALGVSGGEAAVEVLLRALEEETAPEMRLASLRGLARHPTAAAAAPLTALLAETEDPRLRFEIIGALGAIRDGNVRGTLEELVFDPAPAASFAAMRALREQGEAEGAAPILARSLELAAYLGERGTDALLSDLPQSLVALSLQVEALRALAELDPVAGLPAFLASVGPRTLDVTSPEAAKLAEGFYEQQRMALFGLGYTASREALVALEGPAGLGAEDPRLRATAVRSVGVLGFPESAEDLLPFLSDPNADVRWAATSVLGRLAGEGNLAGLSAALADAAVRVRKEAAISLGYLGDARAAMVLEESASHDKDESVRAAAADSLKLLLP